MSQLTSIDEVLRSEIGMDRFLLPWSGSGTPILSKQLVVGASVSRGLRDVRRAYCLAPSSLPGPHSSSARNVGSASSAEDMTASHRS